MTAHLPNHRTRPILLTVVLPVCLAAGLLYLALRGVSWVSVWEVLRHARPRYLALALLTVSSSYILRSARWRVLLCADRRIPLITVFWSTIAGYLGNSFLPARAGEIIRSAMLGRSSGLGTSFVLATAISERLLDAATLVVIGVTASATITGLPAELRHALLLVGSLGLVGVLGLVVAPRLESTLSRLVLRLPLPQRLVSILHDNLGRFLHGMRACQQPAQALQFGALTVVVWLTDAVGASLVAQSLGLTLTIPQALFVLSALGLSSALPSTPGYLGVYQFVCVSLMPLFGYTQEQALAFIVLAQLANYAVITFFGIPMFWLARPRSVDSSIQ